ncbi:hypothetical protein, partial [Pseudoalteromonas sp. SR44-5]|uniref:hypothetical protein n=1 Tax=Pseudoalteromonas sp. SR44-5 TaxID=2760934 RepID=UPI0016028B24
TSIIQPGYAAIPELCYCLQIFDFESLDIDLAYDVIQADMKTLITEQFGQGLTAHLQHSDEGRMRKEMLDIVVNSIQVYG